MMDTHLIDCHVAVLSGDFLDEHKGAIFGLNSTLYSKKGARYEQSRCCGKGQKRKWLSYGHEKFGYQSACVCTKLH